MVGYHRDARELRLTGLESDFLQATSALVCVVDRDGRIVLANPALQRFTGRPAEELHGQHFCDVYVVAEHVELAKDAVARAMATGVAHPQEGDWLAAGGVRRRVAMQNDVLFDDLGRPWAVACVGLDVTERRGQEERLHRRAHTDLLTGLANRSALFEALTRHLDPASGGGCGVLFCDLDDFKVVNDRHGHAVGDHVLTQVAARLRELVAPDDLVARFGGDEFVLLRPAGNPAGLRALADQVVQRIGEPVPGPAGELAVGVSVGIATAGPGEAADVLIARADEAMYGAKTQQRRRRPRFEDPAS
ncbi:diguanylate cyclase domain-containing protein [Modestobacter lapidis]|nr:diguanylate cyclase [Modestobacter lapidis]